jgi:Trypsin-like peptidase domain/Effector-associated domain 1
MVTGPQILGWRQVLYSAFDRSSMADLLLSLNDALAKYEGPNDSIEAVIGKVINAYIQRGWQRRLLTAALVARPDNVEVVRLARSFGVTSLPGDQELQTILQESNSLLNFGNWLEKAVTVQHAVCRIEIPRQDGSTAFGTGFLVSRDLVMTNFHVMGSVVATEDDPGFKGVKAAPNTVTCRFDYRVLSDGSQSAGSVYRLAPQWRALTSVNNPPGREPGNDELDCAVLRLARPAGELAVGDNSDAPGLRRGWINLPNNGMTAFVPDSPLFIVQHPQAEPIKLALETHSVVGVNATGTRVRYKTNTERGSSGSPCFDQDWNLIALHHSGDPNFEFTYNEGIPIDKIVASMKAKAIFP